MPTKIGVSIHVHHSSLFFCRSVVFRPTVEPSLVHAHVTKVMNILDENKEHSFAYKEPTIN